MSRTLIPLRADDLSAFTRALRRQLAAAGGVPPGHVELLHMVARASGHRNYQSLRAQALAQQQVEAKPAVAPAADFVVVRAAARHFDAQGRLATWPAKTSLQAVCLWALWSKLPPRQALGEDALNRILRAAHGFGDHALLRRQLCDAGLLKRTADGREYRRVERQPSPEGLALLRRLAAGRDA